MIQELSVKIVPKDKDKKPAKFIKSLDKIAKENKLKLVGHGESGQGVQTRTYIEKE